VTTKLVLIERVEKMNVIIICLQQSIGIVQRDPYAIDVNRREGRNYYNCKGFRHMAKNYKNRRVGNRIGEGRKLKYEQGRIEEENRSSNLKEEEDLIVFD